MEGILRSIIVTLSLFFSIAFYTTSYAETVDFKVLTEQESCRSPLAQVVFSQQKQIFYQVEVPIYGKGQVHLKPGAYNVHAYNKEGCAFVGSVDIGKTSKTMDIKLDIEKRKPSSARLIESAGLMPTTNPYEYYGFGWPMPYWSPWGYNNWGRSFYYPCAWNFYGCSGSAYPHTGGIAMGKPNIYFETNYQGKFSLAFTSDTFNVLATVPPFAQKRMIGEIKKSEINFENVKYPYIFYDARIEDADLQNKIGYCGTSADIFNFMLNALRASKYPERAVNDFGDYWSVKIPEANRYCVYPQTQDDLAKAAPIDMKFAQKADVIMKRYFFLLVPQDHLGKRIPSKAHKFAGQPEKIWAIEKENKLIKDAKKTYVYEWGVGFVFE